MAVEVFTAPVVTVSSGGVAVALYASRLAITSCVIQAEFTNVGNVVIGGSTVTPSTGILIPPGDTVTITADQSSRGASEEFFLDQVYVNSSTAGNGVRISGFRRQP